VLLPAAAAAAACPFRWSACPFRWSAFVFFGAFLFWSGVAFLCCVLYLVVGLSLLRPLRLVASLPPAVLSLLSAAPCVGVSGSRSAASPSCWSVCAVLAGLSCPVFVGCARGADAVCRGLVFRARVFRAVAAAGSSFAAALVSRSCRFVAALAGVRGSLLVSFPAGACPGGCAPGPRWVSCGSGSWSSAALAAGSGVSVLVFVGSGSFPSWPGFVCVAPGWWFYSSSIKS
jgi:hypothetical protein